MKCLEFKRLVLSDPNCDESSFVEHSADCPECLKYIAQVRQMDADLASSLDIEMPSELTAQLQLNQELLDDNSTTKTTARYAIAASLAVALFVAGFVLNNQISLNKQIGDDYQQLLAGVVEHLNEVPITPVWDRSRANRTINTLLASYEPDLQLKNLDNLQFSRICPMGKYRGLHASLETDSGQITFAYIKGVPNGDLLDASFAGYITRVKPVRGGNLIIFSRNKKSLEQADRQLAEAMVWNI